MKLKTTRISVCIWSEDYQKLADWYEKVLGFKVRRTLNLPDDTVVDFDFGESYFSIGKHSEVHGKSRDPYRIMINFDVESVTEVYNQLKDKDVTIIAKPFESPEGGYYCFTIQDPEGNILQFFSDEK
jgi:predicted enzyme related to lactoylglutathione lyase